MNEDGKRGYVWVAECACTNYPKYGHTHRYPPGTAVSYSDRKKLEDMDPDEAEAARAERRDVRESNKAWDSALKVRQAWLKESAARKTPPKSAAVFIAKALGSATTRSAAQWRAATSSPATCSVSNTRRTAPNLPPDADTATVDQFFTDLIALFESDLRQRRSHGQHSWRRTQQRRIRPAPLRGRGTGRRGIPRVRHHSPLLPLVPLGLAPIRAGRRGPGGRRRPHLDP
ncbi:hypothetical protein [Micromonospora sp. NPDC023737]|uniref:hypothetical protein n=1 Tax=unclassified Micromonospora TaxID=2617518 RepID=UPI00340EA931